MGALYIETEVYFIAADDKNVIEAFLTGSFFGKTQKELTFTFLLLSFKF
jgi:hypothetical protein